MNMGTDNAHSNNVAFNHASNKQNVSSTVHNKCILIFQQKRVVIMNTNRYLILLEGFSWLNGMGWATERATEA